MKRACLLAAILAILLSVGCGKKNVGMSGTFKMKPSLPVGDVTMTFQEDGTFVGKHPAEVFKGTYKLEGRKLSMSVTEVDGKPPQGAEREPATATLSEDGKSFSPYVSPYEGELKYIKQE